MANSETVSPVKPAPQQPQFIPRVEPRVGREGLRHKLCSKPAVRSCHLVAVRPRLCSYRALTYQKEHRPDRASVSLRLPKLDSPFTPPAANKLWNTKNVFNGLKKPFQHSKKEKGFHKLKAENLAICLILFFFYICIFNYRAFSYPADPVQRGSALPFPDRHRAISQALRAVSRTHLF